MEKNIFKNIDPELLQRFKEYHQANPEIYRQFVIYAHRMKGVRKKYSAWTVINVIRWNFDLRTTEPFKINNDFIALYARLLIHHDPSFEGFFELRKMKECRRLVSEEEKCRRGAYSYEL